MASSLEHDLDISEQKHAFLLMRNLQQSRKDSESCDFIIKVEGHEIPVHRAVMSAMSDFFKVMLSHDTAENRSGVVEMKQVGCKFVKKAVEHIYGGKVAICEDDCEEFLIVATMMQLPELCDKIEKFLLPRLNPSKFFEFKRIAEKFDCQLLKEACYEYASQNLGAIAKQDDFKNLEMECLIILLQRESSYSEDTKFAVLLQWIKYDTENRKSFLSNFLGVMKSDKISHQYSRYLVESEALCFESPECLRVLFMGAMNEVTAMTAPPEIPFYGRNNALIMFDQNSKALMAYHPDKATWTRKHHLHPDLGDSLGFTAVVYENMLYVAMATKKFLRLDVLEIGTEWEEMPSMIFEHGIYLKAAVLDGFIYVAGGYSIERFSLSNKEWMKVNSDNVSHLNECAIVAYNKCIYIIGGLEEDASTDYKAVHVFSPQTSTWDSLSALTWCLQRSAAVCCKSKLYFVGGLHSNYRQKLYESKLNSWTFVAYMKKCRSNHSICVIGEQLVAVGGNSPQTMEIYDFTTKNWTEYRLPQGMKIMDSSTVALWLP